MRPARVVMLIGILAGAFPSAALAQYESLENPGSVSAVQERLYRMNHELDLGVGVLPLDAFYKGLAVQVGYTYHFTDSFAWQIARGTYSYSVDTGLREQLERDFGVDPTVFEEVEWMAGSDLVWSPFYGKLAVMNQRVVHFAAFLSLGGTVLKMNVGFRPGIAVGAGLRVFQNKWVSFRLDGVDNVVIADGPRVLHVPTLFLSTALNFGATE
ncbi:MAG: outer membrane beta-barrel domain-containing protein [Myxococcaceae bacterium]|nr:outer membrane beta-barrel domain-containing protein [Myxococcaceae bacterium]